MNRDFDILDVRAGLEEDNDRYAQMVRSFTEDKGVFLINLMASPGAGKTTALCRMIESLSDKYTIGVIEADMDADVDARTVSGLGTRVVQLHTGNFCHMDAKMTQKGLDAFAGDMPDVIIVENVGNLVCPAEFDIGADLKLMILSVPEGDDKPLKYPLMFKVSECMLINKIDTAPVFDFDIKRCERNVRSLNKDMPIFRVSALSGKGFDGFTQWLEKKIGEGLSSKKMK